MPHFVPEERDFERDTQIKEAQVRREREWDMYLADKEVQNDEFIKWVGGSMRKWLAPAPGAPVDENSEKAVTNRIFDIIYTISKSIHTLNSTQKYKVSNFLSWAQNFHTGGEQTRPRLPDLPARPDRPDIKEAVNSLFESISHGPGKASDGPGRMYTNTPSVLYYCIYMYSSDIRDSYGLTPPKQQPMSSDDATCTGASCGGIFDWMTGRKGGTRRRNKKRKSRKSNKRTNRIR